MGVVVDLPSFGNLPFFRGLPPCSPLPPPAVVGVFFFFFDLFAFRLAELSFLLVIIEACHVNEPRVGRWAIGVHHHQMRQAKATRTSTERRHTNRIGQRGHDPSVATSPEDGVERPAMKRLIGSSSGKISEWIHMPNLTIQ